MSGSLSLSSRVGFLTSTLHRPMHSRRRFSITSVAARTVEAGKPGNLYEVLRVRHTASQIEIKAAYRTLAKLFHPDAGSDGQDFMQIHDAYATLSDPTARARYDLSILSNRRFPEKPLQGRRWETDQCW